ncbi:MAG: HlyD family secretion protein [Verrucomicrobiales bacterium]
MSEFHPNRVKPHRPRLTVRRLLNFWPFLVWVAVLGLAFWAYTKGVRFARMNGLVDPIQEAVAADEDSRIHEILVKTGTPVKKDDPVVRLDTEVIDARITKLKAAIRADLEDRLLNHELDFARVKSEYRRILRDQASDDGELAAVQTQLENLNNLLKAQTTPEARRLMENALAEVMSDARKDESRLLAVTQLYPDQLKEFNEDIKRLGDEVTKLREAIKTDPESLAAANGDLSELQELEVLKERSILRSGHDGFVDRVERDNGEFVLKGETILRIVAHPETIRVLLPNDQLGQVNVGDKVWVSSITDRYKYFESEILNLSPRVTNAPNTTSPLPNQVLHGQEIIAKYPKDSGFIPGQPVILHTEEPGRIPFITRLFGGRGRPEQ